MSSTTPAASTPTSSSSCQADPAFTTVAGKANGWTQLAFNTYGTGTGKTIKDGGPSTTALLDPKFRDALGYAVDKKVLVDRVLGGFGDPGDTIVPPILSEWHVTPDTPRTFDLELAKQKLEAAGYTLDANGKRLDKEGKPISLRLVAPNTDDIYAKSAQFVESWYGELGIGVTTEVLDSAVVGNRVLPPEAGDEYKADYDMEIWGWAGNPDPSALLDIFRCEQIGNTSDSQYCNPEYDKLYDAAADPGGRGAGEDPRRDAEPDLRRGAVRRPVLRRQPGRVPQRPLRRLAEHARGRHPAVHLRHAPVHAAHRRDGAAQPHAGSRDGGARLGGARQRAARGNAGRLGGRRDRELGRRIEHRRSSSSPSSRWWRS